MAKKLHYKNNTDYNSKALELYLKEIGKIPLISRDEEKRITRLSRGGDQDAFNRLIEGNLRFVVSIAKKYCNQRLSLLDLINEGNFGLIEAAKRFDPDKGVKFITYAIWWIRQSILKSLAINGYVVKLPLKRANLCQRIKHREQRLRQKFGRKPSYSEIAESLEEAESSVENVMRASNVCLSLEVLTFEEQKNSLKIISQLTQHIDAEEKIVTKITEGEILQLLKMLSPREAEVIHLHFGLNCMDKKLTLEQIGKRYGITKEGVRQIEKKATAKLQAHCEAINC
ncbi:RNA polymerase sigma factor RpoD/SigA [candidate division CSSED10-310 bacterium]|uniref:RNA polymerase sigma factor RpoD/SigA n=1 Tax=candidate division CSSED10-310 bacterium TaxID=2855610 RepID=A0ABV6YTU4_UNCC1